MASSAQHKSALKAARAVERSREFTIYDDKLECVELFKYLGRILTMDDNDMPAVRANLLKARKGLEEVRQTVAIGREFGTTGKRFGTISSIIW